MRIARDAGSVELLFPPGIDSLMDLPYRLFGAIKRGLLYLSFYELEPSERPPRRIWTDDAALAGHMDWLQQKREAEARGENTQAWDRHIDDPVQNKAAERLIVGG